MANGLFNLKQIMQGIQQGGWNGSVNPSYAAYFNGSTQYLNVSTATIAATGQFCIEAWVFQTGRSVSASQGIFSQYSAGVSGRFYFRFNSDKLSFSTSAGDNISTSSVYVNTWYHVAVTRDASNVLRLFINGVLDYNATVTQSLQVTTPQIGGIANGELWNGYISNLRTVSGAIPTAYQTASTTNGTVVFKPSIEPLSTTSQGASGTSLLTLQNATIIDNSSNAYTITNNGTVTTSINYGVFGAIAKPPTVEYLVVAGGGGGGNGGGGGAGGLLAGVDPVPNGQTLLVTVGGGGNGSTTAAAGSTGSNSVFGNITANGGGGGSGYQTAGAAGGSGGGGGRSDLTTGGLGGVGISGQGNSGGTGIGSSNTASGGGGGAGTVGLPAITNGYGGNGGAGIASSISGTVTSYAGGGGAWGATLGSSAGGVGGGGTGANGTANTGGGGAGGGSGTGYNGGSGIVIVSYPDTYASPTTTTGSPTVSTSGSGSLYFDGDDDYLSFANNAALNLGSSNFTLECWFYCSSAPTANDGVITKGNTSSTGSEAWSLEFVNSSGNIGYSAGAYNSMSSYILSSSTAATLNAWNHVAVVRNGTSHTMYLNGVSVATATASYTVTSAGSLYVGTGWYAPTTRDYIGYISNARLVIGTVVYTSAFTPSTIPLTAITNTQLLLNTVSGAQYVDTSTNSFVATVSGTAAWNQLSPFTGTGYKNRVYTWTSSGSITF
jgi:hypothetical protein